MFTGGSERQPGLQARPTNLLTHGLGEDLRAKLDVLPDSFRVHAESRDPHGIEIHDLSLFRESCGGRL